MSLSSFLLKSTGNVDPELDALFKSKPQSTPKPAPIPSSAPSESEKPPKKRKLVEEKHDTHPKRQKSDSKQEVKNKLKPSPKKKSKVKTKVPSAEENDADEDDNSDLEGAYLRSKGADGQLKEDGKASGDDAEEVSEDDASNLVHESLAGKAKSKSKVKSKKQKYVPTDETPARRDQRTVFIGNLSLDVAQKRPLQKQLQRHILSFVPTAKIESIRFRSVPFSSPTAAAAAAATTSSTPNASSSTTADEPHKNPSQREHDRTRASSWRSSTTSDPAPEANNHLTPNQKKKYLFLTHQFHTSGTTVHAYIVFAHPPPPSSNPRPANLPPLPDVLDPYEATKQAVKDGDGSEFEGRIIRVDFVGKNEKRKAKSGEEKDGEEVVGNNKAFEDADPKCTLFVGSLDLAAQEEDLRAFFESLMKTERGEPPSSTDDEGAKKSKTWVTHVRIIRDKDTQLGKGFGYVQFIDRECVDEILTLQPTQLKFAKRKLRVQRCKTLPGTKLSSSLKSSLKTLPAASSQASTSTSKDSKPQNSTPPTPIVIPKGDPSLGNKLAAMSKQERKAVKAADADRVARRLAKKKARMAMGTSKDRASGEGGVEKKRVRERVRKGAGDGGERKGKSGKDVKKRTRVRSDKSLEKRNAKK
ncbi:hypothetical protein D9756_005093 [Leucocoprinus leucothites]|uniref:Nucleolar protein 12 n=1 Tax=Leucocoprinus leucothites TaxID=201217 RepID=A0A8H5G8J3_9AGAR|nr:hypothetical protein D9756_005093 [Leucoagaricus leucothites]